LTSSLTSRTPRSFVDVLRGRAEASATQRAFTFLGGGGSEHSIDAGELDRRARGIAVRLRAHLAPGDRAVLLCLPGLDFVCGLFGCFYAGIVAVPTLPPDPTRLQRTLPRMLGVLADTGARAVVATSAIAAFAPLLAAHAPGLGDMRWIATDHDDDVHAVPAGDEWRPPDAAPHGLALLQYTSGSTGEPKGVMLTHANLLANSAVIQQSFGLSADSIGMSWLPPHHDMGLVGGILQPIFTGFPMVLMSPLSFLERPLRWLEAISRFRVTCSGGPNFAFELCVSRTTADQRAQLDLRSWEVAFSGAEHVRAETLERFAAAFEPSGFRRRSFYPCYGLGEATLIVTGGERGAEPVFGRFDRASLGAGNAVPAEPHAQAIDLVSCGRELADHSLVIVDPDRSERCGEGRVGEIWVEGRSVGRGYWQRPVESQRTFRARLRSQRDRTYLRTGDLGFVRDGELYMVSRAKDVIRIRGCSYWPHDIELAVERSHPALRRGCGAAFAIDDQGEEQLAIVQEIDRRHRADQLDLDEVLERIRAVVAEEIGLPIRLIALLRAGTLPKTTSGKIQRRACRDLLLAGSLPVIREWQSTAGRDADLILPRLPEEEQLARIFCEVLHLERVGVHEPFFDLGGQSVTAAAVVARAREVFGVELPMRALFETPTIAELAIVIAKLQCVGFVPIPMASMLARGDSDSQ
jgi:acyl-CoA synthetase (AMP-forming)/AMP-acid ligase II/acyl carrier protein